MGVMEMTFPHFAQRQDSVGPVRLDLLLAATIARQSRSQTVRTLRRAETALRLEGDYTEQRIHYFAQSGSQKTAARGAFWRDTMPNMIAEQAVYHAGSTNIKVRDLKNDGTGEQLNHAGHGALRKL
jgi:hypothetical protein